MKRHSRVQRKYFLRNLVIYLLCFTFPIVLLGTSLIVYYRHNLQEELSSYADQSRNYILYNINSVLSLFSEETSLFSSAPSLSLALYKLLNEESMDYKNNVYKNTIFSIISTSANLSIYANSIYIYFENPYGNFFSSLKEFTSLTSPDNFDTDWYSLFQNAVTDEKQWITRRQVKYYSFAYEKNTITIFRRLSSFQGVMVINLDANRLSELLSSSQIYDDALTLVTDNQGHVLFGGSGVNGPEDYEEIVIDTSAIKSNTRLPFNSVNINGIDYIYFASNISDYNLTMLSLIPSASVFKSMNSTIITFSIMFIFSILLSISLSWTITNKNFNQLQNLLNLFYRAEHGDNYEIQLRANTKNEYDVIFNNIVQTFISSNLLKQNLVQSEIKQKDAQLAALQLQLSPHFIFNTLQTIDIEVLRLKQQNNNSSRLIHDLSEILKYSLENTFKTINLREEIAICKTYAQIQKFRYENPFILYWDYDDTILDQQVIHLLLQPLLENSLHHGIKGLSRKGLVKIKIYQIEKRIHVHIIDNGIGIEKCRLAEIQKGLSVQNFSQTTHIGIYNTNLRLILTYGDDARIRIMSKVGMGTVVSFSFRI